MEKISREDFTAQNLIELANRAATGEVASKQREQKQRRAVEYDSEEEEGHYDNYGDEKQEIIIQSDKSKETDINGRFICAKVLQVLPPLLPCYACQVLARLPTGSGRSDCKSIRFARRLPLLKEEGRRRDYIVSRALLVESIVFAR